MFSRCGFYWRKWPDSAWAGRCCACQVYLSDYLSVLVVFSFPEHWLIFLTIAKIWCCTQKKNRIPFWLWMKINIWGKGPTEWLYLHVRTAADPLSLHLLSPVSVVVTKAVVLPKFCVKIMHPDWPSSLQATPEVSDFILSHPPRGDITQFDRWWIPEGSPPVIQQTEISS